MRVCVPFIGHCSNSLKPQSDGEYMVRIWEDGRPEGWTLKRQFTKDPGVLPTQIPKGLLILRNANAAVSMMNLSPPLPTSA